MGSGGANRTEQIWRAVKEAEDSEEEGADVVAIEGVEEKGGSDREQASPAYLRSSIYSIVEGLKRGRLDWLQGYILHV